MLSVLSVSPANGITEVPTSTSIILTFNEAVNAATVNSNTISIFGAGLNGSETVAGGYDVSGAVVTFTPFQPLPESTMFSVFVNGVTDLKGDSNYSFSSTFLTGAAPGPPPP
jgi:large repetitive protein